MTSPVDASRPKVAVILWSKAHARLAAGADFAAAQELATQGRTDDALAAYRETEQFRVLLGAIEVLGTLTAGDQAGAPVVHYQVQGGELQPIFTDPPLTPYPYGKFIKPSWIK